MKLSRGFIACITAVALFTSCTTEQAGSKGVVAESLNKLREKGSAAWETRFDILRDRILGFNLRWTGRGDFRRGVAVSALSVETSGGNIGGKTSFDCDVIHQGESIFAKPKDTDDWIKLGPAVAGPDPMSLRDPNNTLDKMVSSSAEKRTGTDEIHGIAVTTYELTADSVAYRRAFNLSVEETEGLEVPKLMASIGSDGLPRRFEIDFSSESLQGGWSLEFSDFGAEVSVTIPPNAGLITEAASACFLGFPTR